MKTIDINIDSWFNRFLSKFWTRIYWDELDFCSYCRKALAALIGVIFLLTFAICASVMFGGLILTAFFPEHLMWSLLWRLPVAFVVGAFLWASMIAVFVGLLFAWFFLYEKLKDKYRDWRIKNYDPDKEPSVIVSGYRALKDKVCFKINPIRK